MVLEQLCQQRDVMMKEKVLETSLISELLWVCTCTCTCTCSCIFGCRLLCRRLCVWSWCVRLWIWNRMWHCDLREFKMFKMKTVRSTKIIFSIAKKTCVYTSLTHLYHLYFYISLSVMEDLDLRSCTNTSGRLDGAKVWSFPKPYQEVFVSKQNQDRFAMLMSYNMWPVCQQALFKKLWPEAFIIANLTVEPFTYKTLEGNANSIVLRPLARWQYLP